MLEPKFFFFYTAPSLPFARSVAQGFAQGFPLKMDMKNELKGTRRNLHNSPLPFAVLRILVMRRAKTAADKRSEGFKMPTELSSGGLQPMSGVDAALARARRLSGYKRPNGIIADPTFV